MSLSKSAKISIIDQEIRRYLSKKYPNKTFFFDTDNFKNELFLQYFCSTLKEKLAQINDPAVKESYAELVVSSKGQVWEMTKLMSLDDSKLQTLLEETNKGVGEIQKLLKIKKGSR